MTSKDSYNSDYVSIILLPVSFPTRTFLQAEISLISSLPFYGSLEHSKCPVTMVNEREGTVPIHVGC